MDKANPVNDCAERKQLAPIVEALYRGLSLQIGDRLVCFRGRGEMLPDLPLSDAYVQALDSAIYVSAYSYAAGGGGLGAPVDQRWLAFGPLHEVGWVLEQIDAPADTAAQVKLQLSFRASVKANNSLEPVQIHVDAQGRHDVQAPPSRPRRDVQR